jgi:DnaD/phage-associated family protein
MNYFLEEMKLDLQDTPIENIFITDFMPLADGTYVKVYLLGYKYANDKEDSSSFNNETIAKNLKIPLSDVLNAWTYWETLGIVKKHKFDDEYNYSVEFMSLKQLYVDKIYKPSAKIDNSYTNKEDKNYVNNKELVELNRDEEFVQMHKEIEKIFGKFVSIGDKRKINQWTKQYELSPEMMIQVFSYCVNNKKKRSMSYIERTVAAWNRAGVTDMDTLAAFLETKEERYSIYSRISQSLGFMNRALTEGEMITIDKWFDEYGFSKEMVLKALENSTKISSPNISYFDAILEKWHEKGFKAIDDIVDDRKAAAKKETPKEKKSSQGTKNKFHNFEQTISEYSEKEMEEIAERNLKKKLEKLGITVTSEG